MTGPHPDISIVIPVHNSLKTVTKCLDSLAALDHPSYEVIMIDDGSTDGTAEACESYDGVTVIRLEKGGPSRARNVGVHTARGEFIAFTDGDCVADRHWLTELEKGFASPNVAGVGGDQRSPEDETEKGRHIQEFLKTIGFLTDYIKTDREMKETVHNPTCNSAYRKSILEEVGGFDETLWPSEDVELDLKIRRLGYKLLYNPAAVVGHYRPTTYGGLARMMRRYGASQWPLFRKYGFFRRIYYAPLALVVGVACFAAMLLWKPWIWPVVLLPLPILFLYFYMKTREWPKSALFFLLFFVTLTNWNWGFFTGYRYRPGA
jgi:cellulose synthase/poly-beta-1,6-N-acetylglucosamine synthase-like glycosyltransferase